MSVASPADTERVTQRHGVVVGLAADQLSVELLPIAGCAGCERQRKAGFGPGHCGIDLLGLSKPSKRTRIDVPLAAVAQIGPACVYRLGDTVEIELPEPSVDWITLAFKVYALPTLGLLVGASVGTLASEPVAILSGFAGLFAGLLIGRRAVHVWQPSASLGLPVGRGLRIVNAVDHLRS